MTPGRNPSTSTSAWSKQLPRCIASGLRLQVQQNGSASAPDDVVRVRRAARPVDRSAPRLHPCRRAACRRMAPGRARRTRSRVRQRADRSAPRFDGFGPRSRCRLAQACFCRDRARSRAAALRNSQVRRYGRSSHLSDLAQYLLGVLADRRGGRGSTAGVRGERIGDATFGTHPTTGCAMRVTRPRARTSPDAALRRPCAPRHAARRRRAGAAASGSTDCAENSSFSMLNSHSRLLRAGPRCARTQDGSAMSGRSSTCEQPLEDLVVAAVDVERPVAWLRTRPTGRCRGWCCRAAAAPCR